MWVLEHQQFAVYVASLGSLRTGGKRGKKVGYTKMCGKQLHQGQRKELVDLLEEYADVFYTEGVLGNVHVGMGHRIRLKEGTVPIAHRPRRLSPDEETDVRKEIDDLMEMGGSEAVQQPMGSSHCMCKEI